MKVYLVVPYFHVFMFYNFLQTGESQHFITEVVKNKKITSHNVKINAVHSYMSETILTQCAMKISPHYDTPSTSLNS